MSNERDTTRIVESWLEEGAHALPDRVLDTVIADLPATRQRHAGWLARRFPIMNSNTFRFGIAAVAVVAVALLGWRFLPGSSVGGEPISTPSPSPIPALPGSGEVPPGRYAFAWNERISIEVPGGWTASNGGVAKKSDSDQEVTFTPALPSTPDVTAVYADACRTEGALEAVGPAVDDLVRALDDQLGTDATITDMELGGRPAKRVDLAPAADLDWSVCQYPLLQVWANSDETRFYALGQGISGSVWVLDLDGERIVLTATLGPDVLDADVAELEAMATSMEFGP